MKDLLGGLFHYVAVDSPPLQEQLQILEGLHPTLAPLLPHAMATLALVRAAYGQKNDGGLDEHVQAAMAAAGVRPGGVGFSIGRHFSVRDLLKWCRRMEGLHSSLLARSLKSSRAEEYRRSLSALPIAVREAAFMEAADCFCALLGRAEVATALLRALAELWALPPSGVEHYSSLNKPTVQLGNAEVTIGRAMLPLLDSSGAARMCSTLAAAAGTQVRGDSTCRHCS